jgi:homoserine O-succinyltransferase
MTVATRAETLRLRPPSFGTRGDARPERWPLRVGFVNNMPDAAFEDTYQQFAGLILTGCAPSEVELHCFYLPSVPRAASVLQDASVPYQDVDHLYADPPDALVITGTEPRSRDLAAEPYWDELFELLRWAEAEVPSTLLSCLAAHAAALALDGIQRVRLPAKQSGVYRQWVDRTHPLSRGLGPKASFPHSRYNEIPGRELVAARYRLMVASSRSGWTIATREKAGRLLTLLQGHPEYSERTLLKEYRRDVRRVLDGTSEIHPEIPVNYFDRAGVELLEAFRDRCAGPAQPAPEDFPSQAAADHIRARWDQASRRLFRNWLADSRLRTALVA